MVVHCVPCGGLSTVVDAWVCLRSNIAHDLILVCTLYSPRISSFLENSILDWFGGGAVFADLVVFEGGILENVYSRHCWECQ